MDFLTAVSELRSGGSPNYQPKNSDELAILTYLKASVANANDDKIVLLQSLESLKQQHAELAYDIQCCRIIFNSEQNSEKSMLEIRRLKLIERARENPGLRNFWLIETLEILSLSLHFTQQHESALSVYTELSELAHKEGFHERAADAIGNSCYIALFSHQMYRYRAEMDKIRGWMVESSHWVYRETYWMNRLEEAVKFCNAKEGEQAFAETQNVAVPRQSFWGTRLCNLTVYARLLIKVVDQPKFSENQNRLSDLLRENQASAWARRPMILRCEWAWRVHDHEALSRELSTIRKVEMQDIFYIMWIRLKIENALNKGEAPSASDVEQLREHLNNFSDPTSDLPLTLLRLKLFLNPDGLAYEIEACQARALPLQISYLNMRVLEVKLEMYLVAHDHKGIETTLKTLIQLANEARFHEDARFFTGVQNAFLEMHKRPSPRSKKIKWRWPYDLYFSKKLIQLSQFNDQEFRVNGLRTLPPPKGAGANLLLSTLIGTAERHLSAEDLTTLVWNETYNPMVHDQRVYQLVHRVREYLVQHGLPANLIENISGKGYRLQREQAQGAEAADHTLEKTKIWIKGQDVFRAGDLAQHLSCSIRQAQRLLKGLVAEKLIIAEGPQRKRRYRTKVHLKRSA